MDHQNWQCEYCRWLDVAAHNPCLWVDQPVEDREPESQVQMTSVSHAERIHPHPFLASLVRTHSSPLNPHPLTDGCLEKGKAHDESRMESACCCLPVAANAGGRTFVE